MSSRFRLPTNAKTKREKSHQILITRKKSIRRKEEQKKSFKAFLSFSVLIPNTGPGKINGFDAKQKIQPISIFGIFTSSSYELKTQCENQTNRKKIIFHYNTITIETKIVNKKVFRYLKRDEVFFFWLNLILFSSRCVGIQRNDNTKPH